MTKQLRYDDIDPNMLSDNIYNSLYEYLTNNGHNINDPKHKAFVTHNELTAAFRYIAKMNMKPNYIRYSLYDYSDPILLDYFKDIYLDICLKYNKSLGLLVFAYMLGIDGVRIFEWLEDQTNPERIKILNNIRECHKQNHISLLNESTIGQIAVANNDAETGLEWAKNGGYGVFKPQAYFLPNETGQSLSTDAIKALPLPPD